MDRRQQDTVIVMSNKVRAQAKVDVQDMAGVTSFPGFFDPAGFSTDVPEGKLLFYREAELKHGRVGMLASLGFVVAEKFHPFFGGQEGNGLSVIPGENTELNIFWAAALLAMGALEAPRLGLIAGGEVTDTDALPGDLGFDPLNLKPDDPEEFKTMQNKELNNGRLAMLAAAGMLAQQLVDGQRLFPGPWGIPL